MSSTNSSGILSIAPGHQAPRRRRQLGRLPVRQQDLGALDELGLAGQGAPGAVAGARSSRSKYSSGRRTLRIQRAPWPMPTTDTDAFDPRIDRRHEHHRRAAIAGAVDAEPVRVGLRLCRQEAQRRLHVGDPAVGRQPGRRTLAVAPALVVEGQHDIAGPVQYPRDVGQIQVPHAGIAVAQHDAGALLARTQIIGQEQVAGELDTLAVEADW